MTPTEQLHAHHAKLIGTIRSLAERTKVDPTDASLLLSFCNEYLISHAEAEEVTLYTADSDAAFVNGMIREHKDIKHDLDAIDSAFGKGDYPTIVTETDAFMAHLDRHFHEEENTLMPRLAAILSQADFEALIAEAHRIESEKKKADVWALFEYDHKRVDLNIAKLRRESTQLENARPFYTKVREQLLKHIELEETVLFPAFEEHATPNQVGPVQVMVAEHREITGLISTPSDLLDKAVLPSRIDDLIGKLAVHNKKEELILYPSINRTIPPGQKSRVYKECFEGFTKV